MRNKDLTKKALKMKINALKMLKNSSLKLTKQRVSLVEVLFKKGNYHFTVEDVFNEINKKQKRISLATVYNGLNQFVNLGILKVVKVAGDKVFFDTNRSSHHHFFCKTTGKIEDINSAEIVISKIPKIPQSKRLESVEIIINVSE